MINRTNSKTNGKLERIVILGQLQTCKLIEIPDLAFVGGCITSLLQVVNVEIYHYWSSPSYLPPAGSGEAFLFCALLQLGGGPSPVRVERPSHHLNLTHSVSFDIHGCFLELGRKKRLKPVNIYGVNSCPPW